MCGRRAFWIDERYDREPAGPRWPDEVAETAHRALVVLVRELNELLTPVIDRLEHSPS